MTRGTRRFRRLQLTALAALAAIAVACTPFVGVTQAEAAAVQGFNPGNIISDSLFYDGSAMTASQVQSFLNQRVPRCTIGDPGRKAGGPALVQNSSGQWIDVGIVAEKCLRNLSISTPTVASNAYCKAYTGKSGETAAQIISRVAIACGISPRVILITLEKEQSLVTDSWPITRQIDVATGYGCPDTGPDYSANCNPKYLGFFNQVYNAAWQFSEYRVNAKDYRYKANQMNTVQWHPNLELCGTSQFRIENSATTGLYIYTPYRPNQAALNAGWGTGDSCSSYGNRNFYNFYKQWFGSTVAEYEVTGGIFSLWQANTRLGVPLGNAILSTANGGGRYQVFEGGTVFEPKSGNTSWMTTVSPILSSYKENGFVSGAWGWPVDLAKYLGVSGQNSIEFQKGRVVEANGSAHLIPTLLVANWDASGGMKGSLGPPTAEAKSGNGVLEQRYQKKTIILDAGGVVRDLDARFLTDWEAAGGLKGTWGTPTGVVASISAGGGGLVYPMTQGNVYKSSSGTILVPNGRILNEYVGSGGPSGAWGWPRGRQICASNGTLCSADFSQGVASWNSSRGVVFSPLVKSSTGSVKPGSGESIVGEVAQ